MKTLSAHIKMTSLVLLTAWPLVACEGPPEEGALEPVSEVSVVKQALTHCSPGPYEAAIFRSNSTASDCNILTLWGAEYSVSPYSGWGEFTIGDNTVTAVTVGSEVSLTLFADRSFQGSRKRYTGPRGFTVLASDWDNRTSSVRLVTKARAACSDPNWRPGLSEIGLYSSSNFSTTGDCLVLSSGDDKSCGGMGHFSEIDVCAGFADNSVSSVRLGAAAGLKVCSDKWFGGCTEINGDIPYMSNSGVGDNNLSSLILWTRYGRGGTEPLPQP